MRVILFLSLSLAACGQDDGPDYITSQGFRVFSDSAYIERGDMESALHRIIGEYGSAHKLGHYVNPIEIHLLDHQMDCEQGEERKHGCTTIAADKNGYIFVLIQLTVDNTCFGLEALAHEYGHLQEYEQLGHMTPHTSPMFDTWGPVSKGETAIATHECIAEVF